MISTNKATLRVVRPGLAFRGKQGHVYSPALSAASVGTEGIHMQLLTIPPGEIGRAHKHEGHETAIYILSGDSGVWFNERLERHATAGAGDFVYIPAGMPHMPYNPSDKADCVAIIARTDPNEQESVILLPELETAYSKVDSTVPIAATKPEEYQR
ncbi:MAG: cupin domain-containing protein [Janthinobacterium lividum]